MHLSLAILAVLLLLGHSPVAVAQEDNVRQVTVSERSIVPLNSRMRFTTMIILPVGDEIQEIVCGDRDYWIISAGQNIAHIKPAKLAASTNLNLVTAAGVVYSFLITENQSAPPDLKVYVNSETTTIAAPRPQTQQSDAEMTALRVALDNARGAADRAQQTAAEAVATFKHQYPGRLQFPYRLPKYSQPFFVRAIWHDGQFTYLKTDARELPALYELKDGRPAFVNFTVQHGLYVVAKVLERGYLAIGKKRLFFDQER
jgi:type IV secretion system protein VirB9